MIKQLDNYFFTQFLEPGEHIDDVVHHHWWALVKPLSTVIIFGITVPILGMWVFGGKYTIYVGFLWLLIGIGYLIFHLIDWFYDAIVLTNSNILDIEWKGVFHKLANRISYEHVDSVSYTIKGVFPTVFQFGDLIISTTGEGEKGLEKTGNVREIQKTILTACDKAKAAKGQNETDAFKKVIKALISEHGSEDMEEEIEPTSESEEEIINQELDEKEKSEPKSVMILQTRSIEQPVLADVKSSTKRRKRKTKKK